MNPPTIETARALSDLYAFGCFAHSKQSNNRKMEIPGHV